MMIESLLRIFAGALLLAANAFFVATEFALTRVRQFDESEFNSHSGLQKAWEMTNELEIYLSGCQVGITISSISLGVVAEPAIAKVFSEVFFALGLTSSTSHSAIAVLLSLGFINIAHVVLGEQVPTYLGVERTKSVAKYLSPLLYIWVRILGPAIRFADYVSKGILSIVGIDITRSWKDDDEATHQTISDIQREVGAVLSGAPLSEEQKREVINALDISNIPVHDIMIPNENVKAISTTQTLDEIIEYVQESPHTRYPLLDDGEYTGILYTAAILQNYSALESGEKTIDDVAEQLMIVPPETSVSDTIDRFQQEEQELAVISSVTQNPLPKEKSEGIVTTTDAFESIAGDLEDPMD